MRPKNFENIHDPIETADSFCSGHLGKILQRALQWDHQNSGFIFLSLNKIDISLVTFVTEQYVRKYVFFSAQIDKRHNLNLYMHTQ